MQITSCSFSFMFVNASFFAVVTSTRRFPATVSIVCALRCSSSSCCCVVAPCAFKNVSTSRMMLSKVGMAAGPAAAPPTAAAAFPVACMLVSFGNRGGGKKNGKGFYGARIETAHEQNCNGSRTIFFLSLRTDFSSFFFAVWDSKKMGMGVR